MYDSPLPAIWSQCYLLCKLRDPDLACPATGCSPWEYHHTWILYFGPARWICR